MSDDTYQGWKNRETWAFDLHWSNDQGLYSETLEQAKQYLSQSPEADDYNLGEFTIAYWRNFLDDYVDEFGTPVPEGLQMFDREVGSWWRVDEAEIGASVRESLS